MASFLGDFTAFLVSLLLLLPVFLFIIWLSNWTRRRFFKAPPSMLYKKRGASYVNRKKEIKQLPTIKEEDSKVSGLFTPEGLLILTEAYVAFEEYRVTRSSNKLKSRGCSRALVFSLDEIRRVWRGRGWPKSSLCFQVGNFKYSFRVKDPRAWIEKIKK